MKVRNGISRLRSFRKNELAASSSEYALILCIVGVGVGAASLALGANVGSSMNGKVDDFNPTFAGSTNSGGSNGNGNGNGNENGNGNQGGGNNGNGNGKDK